MLLYSDAVSAGLWWWVTFTVSWRSSLHVCVLSARGKVDGWCDAAGYCWFKRRSSYWGSYVMLAMFRRRRLSLAVSDSWNMTYSRLLTTTLSSLMLISKHLWWTVLCNVQHLFTSSVSYLHCVLASSAVYCNWSCLWVCVWVCYHNNSKLHASILTKLSL